MSAVRSHQWLWVLLAIVVVAVAAGAVMWSARSGGDVGGKEESTQAREEHIGRMADRLDEAGEMIAKAATEDPHPLVRRAALTALARFPSPRFRPAVEAGTRDATPYARAAAARALGGYGDDAAAVILGRLEAQDPAGGVRIAAVLGLERIATPEAVALLVRAAENNDHPSVRRTALEALSRLHDAHRPSGPAGWAPARWKALDVEIRRVRPAALRPGPVSTQPHENCDCHGHEYGHAPTTTRSRSTGGTAGGRR